MRQAIAELTAFMNGTRGVRRAMTADASRKRKLFEEFLEPRLSFALVGIDFRIRSFQIAVGQRGRRAVTGAGHEDHVEIVFFDQTIQVHPNKTLTGVRTPMAQESILDVLGLKRLFEQRVCCQLETA